MATGSPVARRILVTGARGFIGRATLRLLSAAGFDVHALSRERVAAAGAEWHTANVFDERRVCEVLAAVRPSHVLHLAWETSPGAFWTSPRNRQWQTASEAFLRAFLRCGGGRFVAAGSCAEYDRFPRTPYGESKDAFRRVAEALSREAGAAFVWARIFFAYGPAEPAGKLVSSTIARLLRGEPVVLCMPDRRLDFIHANDVARALVTLAGCGASGAFDVGTGTTHRIGDVVTRIAQILGSESLFGGEQSSERSWPDACADSARLAACGWRPNWPLERGLLSMTDIARKGTISCA